MAYEYLFTRQKGNAFVPVEHEGNQNASVEEAARVAEIVRGLLAGPATWTIATAR